MPKKKSHTKVAHYPGEKAEFCKPEDSITEDLASGFKKRMKNKLCNVGKMKTSKGKY